MVIVEGQAKEMAIEDIAAWPDPMCLLGVSLSPYTSIRQWEEVWILYKGEHTAANIHL